jgi:hypothetical protein
MTYKFCLYCGAELLKVTVEDSTTEVICSKCGKSNSLRTQYCTTCGSPLDDPKRKEALNRLHSYWYCENDNTLMKETTANHQFLISQEIDTSLQEAIESKKLRSDKKPLAKEIAQKVFEYEPKTKFPLLTRTRCPICMDDSLAPVYYQPPHKELLISRSQIASPSQYKKDDQRVTPQAPIAIYVARLNPMDMIQNVGQILKQNPQILVILLIFIVFEVVLNFTQIPHYDLSSILILIFPEVYQEESPIQVSEVLIGIPMDLLIEGVFITLLLVAFKNYMAPSHNQQSTGIFSQGVHFFPKIIIAKLLIDAIATAFIMVNLILIVMTSYLDSVSFPLDSFLFPLIFLPLPFMLVFSGILVGMLMIVFAYVYPSIIMAKTEPMDSLVRSWDFVKQNFWPTVVIVFLFSYVPVLGLSLVPEIIPPGGESVVVRIFETGQLLCFTWGFEKFRTTQQKPEIVGHPSKLQEQRSQEYLYITQPYLYRAGNKAPLRDRFIALAVDSCIVGGLTYAICIGWLYQIGKDYIREGQSFGKGFMGLRVVDFHTGLPATIYQSFIRNCLCGCIDASCCCLAAMIDEDGRRIGDHVAGTVVIRDL